MSTQTSPRVSPKSSSGGIIATLIFVPISTAAWGLFVRYVWNWYVVPLGVHHLPFASATAFAFALSILTYQHPHGNIEPDFGLRITTEIVLIAIAFLTLWILGLAS